MKLESVNDNAFWEYGQIIEGYNFSEMLKVLEEKTPRPLDRIVYVASEPLLESLPVFGELSANFYGGMPIQAGYCNGHGTKLNGLEYHRDSEINITVNGMILFLARRSDLDMKYHTIRSESVRAFFVPSGTAIELYAATLHYAPSSVDDTGFQAAVILPRGTNGPKPVIAEKNGEDRLLFGRNNWFVAHPDVKSKMKDGIHVGIQGENIDARMFWKQSEV
jgi:hypothetical protein